MGDLDRQTVITVGGWDGRYAIVRAVQTFGDQAAAVIDSNGDGADINLEHFQRTTTGQWELCSSSGGAGDWGRGWYDGVWAEHDRDESGWWLRLTPGPERADDAGAQGKASYGWWANSPLAPSDHGGD